MSGDSVDFLKHSSNLWTFLTVRCKGCQYSLSGLTGSPEGGHRCPECGREFDPDDPSTFETDQAKPMTRARANLRALGWLFGIAIGTLLVTWFLITVSALPGGLDSALFVTTLITILISPFVLVQWIREWR